MLVWETRDAGASWTSHGDGLPQQDAYLQVLRQAFDRAGEGDGLELYFGTTSGEIFGSRDAGRRWFNVAGRLPAIASVRVGRRAVPPPPDSCALGARQRRAAVRGHEPLAAQALARGSRRITR